VRPFLPAAIVCLLLASHARAGQPAGQDKPDPGPAHTVREVFAPAQFRFCHDPNYPLTPSEKRWCDLGAAANSQACPALREACKHDATATQVDTRELSFRLPDLNLPWRLVLWTLLGLALIVLIVAVIRRFIDQGPQRDIVTPATSPLEDSAAAALARQIETDVQRLLERARSAAMTGDFRVAMDAAYAALLRRLEGANVVRVQPDQTNGDYLRRVAKVQPVLAPRMAEVVDSVERAQFGQQTVSRETFDKVWSGVMGLLSERIGTVASLLLLFLVGCAQPRADWDYSPSGRAATTDYLGRRGFKVHERLLSLAKISESEADQLIVLPDAQLDAAEWAAVKRWVSDEEGALVIAGGKRALPDWIGMRIVAAPAAQSQPMGFGDSERKRWGNLHARVPEANRLECQAGTEALVLRKQSPYAAERWIGEGRGAGRVLVLADDFLLRNASLLLADNAAVLDALLRDGGTTLELAGDLTGLVASNPVQSVQRGRLGPALLQLAALFLVFFVAKGARFGRPVDTARVQHREFSEHVRALGLHYARAHADRHALGLLGGYVVERLRERCGLRADRSLSGLAEAAAARTGRPVGAVMRLLLEARDAGKGVVGESGTHDLEIAAQLCQLLEEIGGTGGRTGIQSHV
jgi:hypothetical protein